MPDDFDYSQPRRPAQTAQAVPFLTYGLIAASVLLTAASLYPAFFPIGAQRLAEQAVQPPQEIWSGKIWAMLSTAFVHGGILHIAFNMLWLYQLGGLLELSVGRPKYALLVVGAMLAGSGAEIVADGQTGVGMSGVVYALFGAMWAGRGNYPAWRSVATSDNLRLFVGWGLFCVVATALGYLHIANAAHAAGFLFGLSVGGLFFAPRRRPLWAIPLVLLALLTVLSVTYLPWSAEWREWKASTSSR